jgi:hypothetical protein
MMNLILAAFDNLTPMNWEVIKPALNFLWQGLLANPEIPREHRPHLGISHSGHSPYHLLQHLRLLTPEDAAAPDCPGRSFHAYKHIPIVSGTQSLDPLLAESRCVTDKIQSLQGVHYEKRYYHRHYCDFGCHAAAGSEQGP